MVYKLAATETWWRCSGYPTRGGMSRDMPTQGVICNSRLFWMKTIYLSRSDVKPLSLLTGGICDSGRNALTDISRCLPSDDRVHGINSVLWQWRRRLQWRPLLGAPAGPQWCASGAFSSVSGRGGPSGAGHSQTQICAYPALGWDVAARLDGRITAWLPRRWPPGRRPGIIHDNNSYWWIELYYSTTLCTRFM